MNTKYAVALILALQVSMSLSEPSQELSDKYSGLRATFLRRMQTAIARVRAHLEDSERAQLLGQYAETLRSRPEFNAFLRLAEGVIAELSPMVDSGRARGLAWYEENMRPAVREYVDTAITGVKPYLDIVLPVE